LRLDSVCAAIREKFPARIATANVAAATEAYDAVIKALAGEAVHA